MKTVNLKDYYEHIKEDTYIEIADELFAVFYEDKKSEQNYKRQLYRYEAYFSLDRGDGIETETILNSLSLAEKFEKELEEQILLKALSSLPKIQARRIYAYYFLKMSKKDISMVEKVNEKAIRKSINLGISKLKKFLK